MEGDSKTLQLFHKASAEALSTEDLGWEDNQSLPAAHQALAFQEPFWNAPRCSTKVTTKTGLDKHFSSLPKRGILGFGSVQRSKDRSYYLSEESAGGR